MCVRVIIIMSPGFQVPLIPVKQDEKYNVKTSRDSVQTEFVTRSAKMRLELSLYWVDNVSWPP